MSQLSATSRKQSCRTRVEKEDSWNKNMYIERAYLLFSIKLLIRSVRQFNLFIDEIFALPFDMSLRVDDIRVGQSMTYSSYVW